MTLRDVVSRLDEFGADETIYAESAAGSAEAVVALEPDDVSLPYLLEVALARQAIEVWRAWRPGRSPTLDDKVAAVTYYATNDAWLPVEQGRRQGVQTLVAVYLAVGFVLGLALFAWLAVAGIRRHGFRNAVRGAARAYVEELPLYWRVPWAAWTFLTAAPLIALWAIARGEWDPGGAILLALLWLLYLGLLRWHLAAKRRARGDGRAPRG